MPVLQNSGYKAPFYLFSAHLETILPTLFRNPGNVTYKRERIITDDDDFLDLDWSKVGSDKMIIISHGLEGNSQSAYVKGMVRAFNLQDWDALAWNFRGCSGEMNKSCKFYHSGETSDLHFVIEHAIKQGYKTVALIGFSIGGNITLKYLGEQKNELNKKIIAAVAFSVPCHLESGANHLAQGQNRIYLNRFLNSLKTKFKTKEMAMPCTFDIEGIDAISNFLDFDNKYTAPLNGFKDAMHYWKQSSSIYYLEDVRIPTLLVNAKNDPFLPEECYPIFQANKNKFLYLEMPEKGGHVGFFNSLGSEIYWSEERAIEFIENYT